LTQPSPFSRSKHHTKTMLTG